LENVHEYLIIILIKIKDIIMYNIILLPVFPGHEFLHIITDHLKMSLYSESRLQTETGINQNLVLMKLQLRIECILLKFHWGMKALTEVHFHVENVVRSTLSYPNETSKECIQFLFIIIIFKSHQNLI
jgi:hypothetical protein